MVPASISSKPQVEPKAVIERFLGDMKSAAKRTFPAWQETLCSGIDDCAMSFDDKRAVLDVHPLDDYYFAGAVALEASKIRELFPDDQARELLSLIGDHVDAVAERKDRAVSDLVFAIISKVDLTVTTDSQKMPYDEVVSAILRHLGVDKIEATKHLMSDALYRHTLGEPLALGIPHWWHTFKSKYELESDCTSESADVGLDTPVYTINSNATKAKVQQTLPRKPPRRAVAF